VDIDPISRPAAVSSAGKSVRYVRSPVASKESLRWALAPPAKLLPVAHDITADRAGRAARPTATLSLLRRAHDHPADVAALDAPAPTAAGARTGREGGDAMTRHGPRLHHAVILSWQPSKPRTPRGSRVPPEIISSSCCSDCAERWCSDGAVRRGQNALGADPTGCPSRYERPDDHGKYPQSHKHPTVHRGFVLRRLPHAYGTRNSSRLRTFRFGVTSTG